MDIKCPVCDGEGYEYDDLDEKVVCEFCEGKGTVVVLVERG